MNQYLQELKRDIWETPFSINTFPQSYHKVISNNFLVSNDFNLAARCSKSENHKSISKFPNLKFLAPVNIRK